MVCSLSRGQTNVKMISKAFIACVLVLAVMTGCAGPAEKNVSDSQTTNAQAEKEPSGVAQAEAPEDMLSMSDEEQEAFRVLLNQMAERFIVLQGEVGLAYEADGKTAVTDTINGEPMNLVDDPRFHNLEELKTWLGETMAPEYPAYAALLEPQNAKTAVYQVKDGKLYVRIAAAVYDFSKESQEQAKYWISKDGKQAEIQMPWKPAGAITRYLFRQEGDVWLLYAVK